MLSKTFKLASWLGQSGVAAVKQARDFDFSVTVVSGSTEYTETIIGQGKAPETAKETVKGETSKTIGETVPAEKPAPESASPGSFLMRWLPAIIAGAVVILGAIIIPLLVRRRR